jgi:molybdenum cofactor synthesis domain-containing protein
MPEAYFTILMRRFMMRIADRIAADNACGALVTGENLGQVASQTMTALGVTEAVCTRPVLRPLIGFDKEEIVRRARAIGTFETSVLPYEDCCTVFTPRHPELRPTAARACGGRGRAGRRRPGGEAVMGAAYIKLDGWKTMNAEILSVGTELLLGNIVNTDARDLAIMLSELGINAYWQTVVGDNPGRLREALNIAAGRADCIITTGGLGPTCDDLTKQTLCETFGQEMYFDERAKAALDADFGARYGKITENNLQQCCGGLHPVYTPAARRGLRLPHGDGQDRAEPARPPKR